MRLAIMIVVALAVAWAAPAPPAEFTSRVLDAILREGEQGDKGRFFVWDYGSGIILDGLYEAAEHFGFHNYTARANAVLDQWITTPGAVAYNVLNNVQMPWDTAVGDHIGLYPFAYLDRVRFYRNHPELKPANYSEGRDIEIARRVVDQYVVGWPFLLQDGTFYRDFGFPNKTKPQTVIWGDDQFMGLTILVRLATLLNDSSYLSWAARQTVNFATIMQDASDGLYAHGASLDGRFPQPSPCKWGRANGWGIMAHAEVLEAFTHFPGHPLQPAVLGVFQSHATALRNFQTSDGRWHQVVNETSTYLETSVTSMTAFALARGVQRGWIPADRFLPTVRLAYQGLNRALQTDGTVSGICCGTGIYFTVADYEKRPSDYLESSPGLGSVVRAAVAYDQLNRALQ